LYLSENVYNTSISTRKVWRKDTKGTIRSRKLNDRQHNTVNYMCILLNIKVKTLYW